jgi:ABC-2 type transport system permease protein
MRNIWLIIKHEIVTTLTRRSFWVMTFLFPAAIIALNIGTQVIASRTLANEGAQGIGADSATAEGATADGATADGATADVPTGIPTVGYIDEAGLIRQLPEGMPANLVRALADETAAQTALAAGEIERYFVIPADYLAMGELTVVVNEFRPFSDTSGGVISYLINYNLTGDPMLASRLIDPTPMVQNQPVAPQGGPDDDNPLTFIVPFATMFIFFFLITMSSGYMLQSVTREKENRTAEILLLSLRPRELMLGKVVGLSVVALFQMIIWLGGGLLALEQSRQMLETAARFTPPPGFIIWAVLYFFLGYLLYASLMGALGALAPNAREGNQFTFFILLPLLVPIWLNNTFAQSPNGSLALFLSLFPLTAPTSMMTRLVTGGVPLWQPIAGLIGLAITTYLFVLLAARFFRADTLLSTSSLQWQRLWRELRTR